MAENKLLRDSALSVVIDDNAALTNGSRAAGDYDNGPELDVECEVYLQVQYDAGPPAAGTRVADLYVLPGDGAGTQIYPDGGDAGLGTDDDPQSDFFVGSFTSINPSTSVNEILGLPRVRLYGHGNRFVLKNISGQTFDSTWELRIKPSKSQTV